jgi:hypothetical protein
MPTVLRIKGYRFFFFVADGYEPPHIHVAKEDRAAKFWLDPIEVARNEGFRKPELQEVAGIVRENLAVLNEAWFARFGRL